MTSQRVLFKVVLKLCFPLNKDFCFFIKCILTSWYVETIPCRDKSKHLFSGLSVFMNFFQLITGLVM